MSWTPQIFLSSPIQSSPVAWPALHSICVLLNLINIHAPLLPIEGEAMSAMGTGNPFQSGAAAAQTLCNQNSSVGTSFLPYSPLITSPKNGRSILVTINTTHLPNKQHTYFKATRDDGISSASKEYDDDGISLGTMKLPSDTDLVRFETLLFQWANSLCQGANLPMPMPLKVDKIRGGARIGFITIGDGETEVQVYIDCLVFASTDGSCPVFRAIRNGAKKDGAPPGEPRIMRSLLAALKKSVEIARV